LAADSRAVYGASRNASECKLFEIQDVYATVSGLARYGSAYRASDAIRDGFAGPGTFERHVTVTAFLLKHRIENLLSGLQLNNPTQYGYLMRSENGTSDFVQIALAQNVKGRPMLGIIELQHDAATNVFTARTLVCPGNCRQDTGIFYLGYWERIKPYVADSGQPRNVGSAASIDRLIRLEMQAHPAEVGAPINILEVNDSGARWLQNGGNCSLPGVSW
jgi:hypothetical protein